MMVDTCYHSYNAHTYRIVRIILFTFVCRLSKSYILFRNGCSG